MDKLIIVIIITLLSSQRSYLQLTGEWAFEDFPESDLSDLHWTNDDRYLLIRSIHSSEDTANFNYQTAIYAVDIIGDNLLLDDVFYRNTGTQRFVASSFTKLGNQWVYIESTVGRLERDTLYCLLFNEDIVLTETLAQPIHGHIEAYRKVVYDSNYAGIGGIFVPPDSLVAIHNTPGSSQNFRIHTFRTPSPSISFVSSITYDSQRARFLIFHLSGITHLNDTFGIIQRYPGGVIHTSDHGTVIAQAQYYYSFGATAFQGSPEFRDLVFQQYDTSMQVLFRDTFGRAGRDDYPFIDQSLDTANGNFFVGGHHAGPSNFTHRDTLRFFVSKYNSNLEQLWYREFGGSHSYVIRGLKALQDGRLVLYGLRVDTDDGLRYPYLLILDENGEITSTEIIPDPDIHLVDILYPTDSGKFVFEAQSDLKTLRLYSMDGKVVLRLDEILPERHAYDVPGLPAGMYVFVASDGMISQSGKWLKTK